MDRPADRLHQARSAKFLSATLAANVIGVKSSTLAAHESGQNSMKIDVIVRYAAAFGVSKNWLAFGEGPMRGFSDNTNSGKSSALAKEAIVSAIGRLLDSLRKCEVEIQQIRPEHDEIIGRALAKQTVDKTDMTFLDALEVAGVQTSKWRE